MIQVGNTLHQLLFAKYGVDMAEGCGCGKMVALMNAWGPKGCRENLTLIASKMLREAEKRSWTFENRPLLTKAARVGSKLPFGMMFARTWIRKIILEAIERSETCENQSNGSTA